MKTLFLVAIAFFGFWWYLSDGSFTVDSLRAAVERASEGRTESEKAMRHPERMTPEQRQLALDWGAGAKETFVFQASELEKRIDARAEGGYSFDRPAANAARSAVRKLNRAIDRDDFIAAPALMNSAADAVRRFEASCRWQVGARHKKHRHIRSAAQEGRWDADPGWMFPERGSLEPAMQCGYCNGTGRQTVDVRCEQCDGDGVLSSPAMPIVNGLFGGNRLPESLPCLKCNGKGWRTMQQSCSVCSGRGWVR